MIKDLMEIHMRSTIIGAKNTLKDKIINVHLITLMWNYVDVDHKRQLCICCITCFHLFHVNP